MAFAEEGRVAGLTEKRICPWFERRGRVNGAQAVGQDLYPSPLVFPSTRAGINSPDLSQRGPRLLLEISHAGVLRPELLVQLMFLFAR